MRRLLSLGGRFLDVGLAHKCARFGFETAWPKNLGGTKLRRLRAPWLLPPEELVGLC